MLELKQVGRDGGGRALIDDVSLELRDDEIATIMGPSGAGKTSLLRMIIGLDTPDRGQITLHGKSLNTVLPERRGMSMVFQEFTLFPHLDVLDNVTFGDGAGDRTSVMPILEMLEIDSLANRRIGRLSGGEQQRVALARSLAISPRVLLLDEPFSNVDHMLRDRLYARFKAYLKSQGIAAIIATHDHHEAFSLSDTIHVMRAGKRVASQSPVEIYHRPDSRWVAGFFGRANVLTADELRVLRPDLPPGTYLLRPEWLAIAAEGPEGRIVEEVFLGPYRDVRLDMERGGALWLRLDGATEATLGTKMRVGLRPGLQPHPLKEDV